MSGKSQEQICPHCSKSFVRIGSHKCKMAPTPTHDTNQCKAEEALDSNAQATMAAFPPPYPVMNALFQKESSPPADGLAQCATCKKMFKQLSKHKSKVTQSEQHTDDDKTSRSEKHVVSDDTGAKEDLPLDGQRQCTSCKQYFKQLSRQKCEVKQLADAKEVCNSEREVVRDAGAKDEVLDKTAADGKRQCPSCKEYFKQLSRHKCKVKQLADAEEVCNSDGEVVLDAGTKDEVLDKTAADGKRQCPSCKQIFKQLSRHKCKVKQLADAEEVYNIEGEVVRNAGAKDEVLGKTEADGKRQCPSCKEYFKQLSRHKCKVKQLADAEEVCNSEGEVVCYAGAKDEVLDKTAADGKRQCPSCKQYFKQISRHKCKVKQLADAEEVCNSDGEVVRDAGARDEVLDKTAADGKRQCPSCKQYFKQISRHKCKVKQLADAEEVCNSDGEVVRDAEATDEVLDKTAADGKRQCPSCKQYFKQISRHKCKVKQLADAEEVCNIDGEVVLDAGTKDEVLDKTAADEKRQCPSCKQTFKQLSRHKCKVKQLADAEEVCNSDVEVLLVAEAKDEVLDKTAADGERQCPSCKEYFKQLSRHKCKVKQPADAEEVCDSEGEVVRDAGAVSAISSRGDAADNYNSRSLALYETVGHQPVIDTGKLDDVAVELMDSLLIDHASSPVRTGDDFFDKEVKLEQSEKESAKRVFKPFRKKIKYKLKKSTCWSWDYLFSGSYADGTKVTRPDEIDIMWHPNTNPKWLEPIFKNAPPGFCFVKLRKLENNDVKKHGELADLCTNDGFVSSEKFRDKTHKIFEAAIKEKRKASARKDPASKEGSPSYAVELDTVPGKPPIAIDLVPCLHLEGWPDEVSPRTRLPREVADFVTEQGYDVIPKACKDEKYGDKKHLLWRLSFSRSEKRMTNYVDGKKIRNLQMRDSADRSEVAPEQSGHPFSVPPSPSYSINSGFESLPSRTDSYVSDADDDILTELQTSEDAERGSKGAAKKQKLPPTCRKSVLRMLKRILEITKRFENSRSIEPCAAMTKLKVVVDALHKKNPDFKLEKFSTFQIRTLMWTEYYITNPGDCLWKRENRRARLSHALTQLKKMVSGRMHVPHFFLPALDIMEDCTLKEREFLYIIFAVVEKLF